MFCKKCYNNLEPVLYKEKMHTRITCRNCGAFIKWANKDEREFYKDKIINKNVKKLF